MLNVILQYLFIFTFLLLNLQSNFAIRTFVFCVCVCNCKIVHSQKKKIANITRKKKRKEFIRRKCLPCFILIVKSSITLVTYLILVIITLFSKHLHKKLIINILQPALLTTGI